MWQFTAFRLRAQSVGSSPTTPCNERGSSSIAESGRQWGHGPRYLFHFLIVRARLYSDHVLVYHVLLHLYNRLPLGNFFRLIEDGGSRLASASKLLQVYAREQNREMLRDFYFSDDRRVESAVLLLEEAARMQVPIMLHSSNIQTLIHVTQDPNAKVTAVKAAHKFFSEDKERAFEAKVLQANLCHLLDSRPSP